MKQQRGPDPSLAPPAPAEADNLLWSASWVVGEQASLGEFADRVDRLVRALRQLHPMFKELYLIGESKKDSPELAADLSNLRPWVFARSWHQNGPSNVPYSHYDDKGMLTAGVQRRHGILGTHRQSETGLDPLSRTGPDLISSRDDEFRRDGHAALARRLQAMPLAMHVAPPPRPRDQPQSCRRHPAVHPSYGTHQLIGKAVIAFNRDK